MRFKKLIFLVVAMLIGIPTMLAQDKLYINQGTGIMAIPAPTETPTAYLEKKADGIYAGYYTMPKQKGINFYDAESGKVYGWSASFSSSLNFYGENEWPEAVDNGKYNLLTVDAKAGWYTSAEMNIYIVVNLNDMIWNAYTSEEYAPEIGGDKKKLYINQGTGIMAIPAPTATPDAYLEEVVDGIYAGYYTMPKQKGINFYDAETGKVYGWNASFSSSLNFYGENEWPEAADNGKYNLLTVDAKAGWYTSAEMKIYIVVNLNDMIWNAYTSEEYAPELGGGTTPPAEYTVNINFTGAEDGYKYITVVDMDDEDFAEVEFDQMNNKFTYTGTKALAINLSQQYQGNSAYSYKVSCATMSTGANYQLSTMQGMTQLVLMPSADGLTFEINVTAPAPEPAESSVNINFTGAEDGYKYVTVMDMNDDNDDPVYAFDKMENVITYKGQLQLAINLNQEYQDNSAYSYSVTCDTPSNNQNYIQQGMGGMTMLLLMPGADGLTFNINVTAPAAQQPVAPKELRVNTVNGGFSAWQTAPITPNDSDPVLALNEETGAYEGIITWPKYTSADYNCRRFYSVDESGAVTYFGFDSTVAQNLNYKSTNSITNAIKGSSENNVAPWYLFNTGAANPASLNIKITITLGDDNTGTVVFAIDDTPIAPAELYLLGSTNGGSKYEVLGTMTKSTVNENVYEVEYNVPVNTDDDTDIMSLAAVESTAVTKVPFVVSDSKTITGGNYYTPSQAGVEIGFTEDNKKYEATWVANKNSQNAATLVFPGNMKFRFNYKDLKMEIEYLDEIVEPAPAGPEQLYVAYGTTTANIAVGDDDPMLTLQEDGTYKGEFQTSSDTANNNKYFKFYSVSNGEYVYYGDTQTVGANVYASNESLDYSKGTEVTTSGLAASNEIESASEPIKRVGSWYVWKYPDGQSTGSGTITATVDLAKGTTVLSIVADEKVPELYLFGSINGGSKYEVFGTLTQSTVDQNVYEIEYNVPVNTQDDGGIMSLAEVESTAVTYVPFVISTSKSVTGGTYYTPSQAGVEIGFTEDNKTYEATWVANKTPQNAATLVFPGNMKFRFNYKDLKMEIEYLDDIVEPAPAGPEKMYVQQMHYEGTAANGWNSLYDVNPAEDPYLTFDEATQSFEGVIVMNLNNTSTGNQNYTRFYTVAEGAGPEGADVITYYGAMAAGMGAQNNLSFANGVGQNYSRTNLGSYTPEGNPKAGEVGIYAVSALPAGYESALVKVTLVYDLEKISKGTGNVKFELTELIGAEEPEEGTATFNFTGVANAYQHVTATKSVLDENQDLVSSDWALTSASEKVTFSEMTMITLTANEGYTVSVATTAEGAGFDTFGIANYPDDGYSEITVYNPASVDGVVFTVTVAEKAVETESQVTLLFQGLNNPTDFVTATTSVLDEDGELVDSPLTITSARMNLTVSDMMMITLYAKEGYNVVVASGSAELGGDAYNVDNFEDEGYSEIAIYDAASANGEVFTVTVSKKEVSSTPALYIKQYDGNAIGYRDEAASQNGKVTEFLYDEATGLYTAEIEADARDGVPYQWIKVYTDDNYYGPVTGTAATGQQLAYGPTVQSITYDSTTLTGTNLTTLGFVKGTDSFGSVGAYNVFKFDGAGSIGRGTLTVTVDLNAMKITFKVKETTAAGEITDLYFRYSTNGPSGNFTPFKMTPVEGKEGVFTYTFDVPECQYDINDPEFPAAEDETGRGMAFEFTNKTSTGSAASTKRFGGHVGSRTFTFSSTHVSETADVFLMGVQEAGDSVTLPVVPFLDMTPGNTTFEIDTKNNVLTVTYNDAPAPVTYSVNLNFNVAEGAGFMAVVDDEDADAIDWSKGTVKFEYSEVPTGIVIGAREGYTVTVTSDGLAEGNSTYKVGEGVVINNMLTYGVSFFAGANGHTFNINVEKEVVEENYSVTLKFVADGFTLDNVSDYVTVMDMTTDPAEELELLETVVFEFNSVPAGLNFTAAEGYLLSIESDVPQIGLDGVYNWTEQEIGGFEDNGDYLLDFGTQTAIDLYKGADGGTFTITLKKNEDSRVLGVEMVDGMYRVYNLNGVNLLNTKVANDLELLENGIYIVNGKKLVIRK